MCSAVLWLKLPCQKIPLVLHRSLCTVQPQNRDCPLSVQSHHNSIRHHHILVSPRFQNSVSQQVTRLLIPEHKSALVLLINGSIHTQTPPHKRTAFDSSFSFPSIKVVSFYICPPQHSSTAIHPFIAIAGTCHRSDSPNTIFEELHEVSIPTNPPGNWGGSWNKPLQTSIDKPELTFSFPPYLLKFACEKRWFACHHLLWGREQVNAGTRSKGPSRSTQAPISGSAPGGRGHCPCHSHTSVASSRKAAYGALWKVPTAIFYSNCSFHCRTGCRGRE